MFNKIEFLFLLLSLISTTVLFAQSTPKSIHIQLTPEITSMIVSENSVPEDTDNSFGFTTTIFYEQFLNNHWSIIAGFGISQRKYIHNGKKGGFTLESNIVILPDGTTQFVGSSIFKATANLRHIEIPLQLRYDVWKKKFFVSTGFTLQMLLQEKYDARLIAGDGTISDLDPNKFDVGKYNFLANASFGYRHSMGRRLAFSVHPTFSVALLKNDFLLYKSKINFLSLGLNLGMEYSL